MNDDDDLFEVDLEVGRLHVFESDGAAPTIEALRARGIEVVACRLGSELMAAAADGHVSAVIIGHSADPELRELFMRAFRGRFPTVPVVFVSKDANDPQAVAAMKHEGAMLVVPWPLPAVDALRSTLESAFSLEPVPAPPPKRVMASDSNTVVVEQDLLARKAQGLDGTPSQREDSVSVQVFETAVKEVAQKAAQNTELRSELTIATQRHALLEERIQRLNSEMQALTFERDQMRAKLQSPEHANHRGENTNAKLAAVENLVAGVETYAWGLEQAIQYLEELKHKVGSRAPSLDVHLRSLKLLKAMLERLRDKMTG